MDSKKKAVEAQHPLACWIPECSITPMEWLMELQNEKSVYHKLSLLQFGLDLSPRYGEHKDVVKTYFAYAEGHTGNLIIPNIFLENDTYRRDTPFGEKKLRHLHEVVARKAFEMICNRILKNTVKSESSAPSWAAFVQNEENLNMLLHFFRLKNDPSDKPRFVNLKYFGSGNGGHDSHTMVAVKFLTDLVNWTWPKNDYYPSQWNYKEIKQMFRSKRQKMIEIMYGLFMLPRLHKRALTVNGSSMKWLKEIALKESKCETVEEAIYQMNEAARVWHILSVIRKAHGHQIEVQRAEERAAEAEAELKRLKA